MEELVTRLESATVATLKKIVDNVLLNEGEEKFMKLRRDNTVIRGKIMEYPAAIETLHFLGFVDEGEVFVLPLNYDRELLKSFATRYSSRDNKRPVQTTSSSSTSKKAKSEDVLQLGTTVTCDACQKARILSDDETESLTSSTWVCANLSRLQSSGGCDVPDDELRDIVGDQFVLVFEQMGIKLRSQLAATSIDEYDAGPWEGYLDSWIQQAQGLEVIDIMTDILGDDSSMYLDPLRTLSICSPVDVLDHRPESIVQLFIDRIGEPPSYCQVVRWQNNARLKLDEIKWLALWSSIPEVS